MAESSSGRDRAATAVWVVAMLGGVLSFAVAERAFAGPAATGVRVWVAHETDKVRPDAEPVDARAIDPEGQRHSRQ